jgi:hypothetical protein
MLAAVLCPQFKDHNGVGMFRTLTVAAALIGATIGAAPTVS